MSLSEGTVKNIPPNERSEGNPGAQVCCGPLLGPKGNVVGWELKTPFTTVISAVVNDVDGEVDVASANCEIASEAVELVDVSDVVGSVGLESTKVGVEKV